MLTLTLKGENLTDTTTYSQHFIQIFAFIPKHLPLHNRLHAVLASLTGNMFFRITPTQYNDKEDVEFMIFLKDKT